MQNDTSYKVDSHHTLGAGFYLSGEAISWMTMRKPSWRQEGSKQLDSHLDHQQRQPDRVAVGILSPGRMAPDAKADHQLRRAMGLDRRVVTRNQLSPRVGLEYEVTRGTILHGGYARYCKVPPFDQVALGTVKKPPAPLTPRRRAAAATKSERKLTTTPMREQEAHPQASERRPRRVSQLGHNQLDLAQFGGTVVTAPLTYRRSRAWGSDFSLAFEREALSAYLNFSYTVLRRATSTRKRSWPRMRPNQLHRQSLGHARRQSDVRPARASAAYKLWGFLFTADGIWGSGYRRGFANSGQLPPILQFNAGIVRGVKLPYIGEAECR